MFRLCLWERKCDVFRQCGELAVRLWVCPAGRLQKVLSPGSSRESNVVLANQAGHATSHLKNPRTKQHRGTEVLSALLSLVTSDQ